MQETVPTDTLATQRARLVICPMCWSLPGRPCSVSGPPADHLARWVRASKAGQVSREQLGAVAVLRQLEQIRLVLDLVLGNELADRQYALEQIDDIIRGDL
jgi:hypothetical protein